jgi:hypothetical protein
MFRLKRKLGRGTLESKIKAKSGPPGPVSQFFPLRNAVTPRLASKAERPAVFWLRVSLPTLVSSISRCDYH